MRASPLRKRNLGRGQGDAQWAERNAGRGDELAPGRNAPRLPLPYLC